MSEIRRGRPCPLQQSPPHQSAVGAGLRPARVGHTATLHLSPSPRPARALDPVAPGFRPAAVDLAVPSLPWQPPFRRLVQLLPRRFPIRVYLCSSVVSNGVFIRLPISLHQTRFAFLPNLLLPSQWSYEDRAKFGQDEGPPRISGPSYHSAPPHLAHNAQHPIRKGLNPYRQPQICNTSR
jgi:hypothetical protein